jgi:hypothetical protein
MACEAAYSVNRTKSLCLYLTMAGESQSGKRESDLAKTPSACGRGRPMGMIGRSVREQNDSPAAVAGAEESRRGLTELVPPKEDGRCWDVPHPNAHPEAQNRRILLHEPLHRTGRDRFHSVPIFPNRDRDAVERVPDSGPQGAMGPSRPIPRHPVTNSNFVRQPTLGRLTVQS